MLGSMNCQSDSPAVGQGAQLGFREFKDGGFLKKMAIEITDFVFAKRAAPGHDRKKFFQGFGKQFWVVNAGLGNVGEQIFRQKAGVFRKEAKHDAIQKPGDAQIFPLREIHFLARPGVRQFHGFALLQRLGNLGNVARRVVP